MLVQRRKTLLAFCVVTAAVLPLVFRVMMRSKALSPPCNSLHHQTEEGLEKMDTFLSDFQQDDVIVVAVDKKANDRRWSFGQVRRYAVHEPWPLNRTTANAFYPKFLQDNGGLKVYPTSTNRTSTSTTDHRYLIYNRVPKCASSTVIAVLQELARTNHHLTYSWPVFWSKQLTTKEELDFLSTVFSNQQGPFVVDRHFYFIDVEKYGLDFRPSWINMVRDPIDRFVSMYYFLRSPKRWNESQELPPQEWFEKDINQCILLGDLECQFNSELRYLKEHQLTFFCGSAQECRRVGSRAALQKAKHNAEKYFSVIGISSDIESSLSVMESFLPLFFKGALQTYHEMGLNSMLTSKHPLARFTSPFPNVQRGLLQSEPRQDGRARPLLFKNEHVQYVKNDNPFKKGISEQAKLILRSNMSLEYEFFAFVRQRLYLQRQSLGLLGTSLNVVKTGLSSVLSG